MKNKKAAREFWINVGEEQSYIQTSPGHIKEEHELHVIEKSAYDELKFEYEATEKVYRINRNAIEDLKQENKKLQAQLDKVERDKASNDQDYLSLSIKFGNLREQCEALAAALNKIADPHKYHHYEKDDYTRAGCFQHVAIEALAEYEKFKERK